MSIPLIELGDIGAVDFDGTLCEHKFPDIGREYHKVITACKQFREDGGKLILWTCREGEDLQVAIDWCKQRGLEFDAENENIDPEYCKEHGFAQRKIVANWYLDDRGIGTRWLFPFADEDRGY